MNMVMCAGAPLGPELELEFTRKLRAHSPNGEPKAKFMSIFGMSELTGMVRYLKTELI
jgi:acyl-CoA synthetase (AMP-forming)/AMP-acid ligase II